MTKRDPPAFQANKAQFDPLLKHRIERQFDKPDPESFDRVQFLAALDSYRGDPRSGSLMVTFAVGPGERWEALPVTNALNELLLITVERISYDGTAP